MQRGDQAETVCVADLSWSGSFAGLDQLVAGRQDAHSGTPYHRHRIDTQTSQEAHLSCAEETPLHQHDRSLCQIDADGSDVFSGIDAFLVNDHMLIGKLGRLDRHHRGGTRWHRRSGCDPGGGAKSDLEVSYI